MKNASCSRHYEPLAENNVLVLGKLATAAGTRCPLHLGRIKQTPGRLQSNLL